MLSVALDIDYYLAALRDGDEEVVKEIYKKYLPGIREFIRRKGGSESDAKDIFQDALIVAYEGARKQSFQPKSSFGALLQGICKNLWCNYCQKKSRQVVTFSADVKLIPGKPFQIDFKEVERQRLLDKCMMELGEECPECRELLLHYFQEKPFKELVEKWGKAEGTLRVKKHRCQEKLIELLKSKPEFKELLGD